MIWYQALVIDISLYIFTVAFLYYLWLFHLHDAFHFRTSYAHNFFLFVNENIKCVYAFS